MRKLIGLVLAGGLLAACGSNRGETRYNPPPEATQQGQQSGMENAPAPENQMPPENAPEQQMTPENTPEQQMTPENTPPPQNQMPPESAPQNYQENTPPAEQNIPEQ